MHLFNMKKNEEYHSKGKLILETRLESVLDELRLKSSKILQLELEISQIISKHEESKTNLTIAKVSNQNIPPEFMSKTDQNTSRRNLATTTLTNYPEPCKACNLNQCNYDLNHELYFTISGAVEKTMDEFNKSGALDKVFGEINLKVDPPDKI